VLQEVKYLEATSLEPVPSTANHVYSLRDTLRKYVINLDLTVFWYNNVRQTVLEVEYPLIEHQLENIDLQLSKAENELTWQSEGIKLNIEFFKAITMMHNVLYGCRMVGYKRCTCGISRMQRHCAVFIFLITVELSRFFAA
jgi:Dynein heavy chain, N-terminal region 1